MTTSNKIYESLANVQSWLIENPIEKSKFNSFSKYDYRGIDDVYASFAKPLCDNKIVTNFLPDLKIRVRTLDDGKTTESMLKGTIRFLSLEDGSFVDTAYVGKSKSTQGRDLEAAKSFAYRDALIQFFCVPFEQTVEPEEVGDDDKAPEDSLLDMFKGEIANAKSKADQEKVFKKFDKAANLAEDKTVREQVGLHYAKVVGANNG